MGDSIVLLLPGIEKERETFLKVERKHVLFFK